MATRSFRIVPKRPSYVLRFPNGQEAALGEVLRRYNGFVPGQGWVDLLPGMELRIENAYYQKGASRRGLAGFLGTEVARYEVGTEGLQLLTTRSMPQRPTDDAPVERLIGETEEHFRFYRLYYEIVFGGPGGSHGSVLLGAQSKEELMRLSDELGHPEDVCNAGSTHCAVFPEACSVSVEIKITVNGKPQTVAWGSTLERITEESRHLSVKRLYRGRLTPVKMNAADPNVLRLPLLPGDEINWD